MCRQDRDTGGAIETRYTFVYVCMMNTRVNVVLIKTVGVVLLAAKSCFTNSILNVFIASM